MDSEGEDAAICMPDSIMQLNVSSSISYVTLHPALRYPDIQNLRVEVAGQVLSQGGNIGADQLADTTAKSTTRQAESVDKQFTCHWHAATSYGNEARANLVKHCLENFSQRVEVAETWQRLALRSARVVCNQSTRVTTSAHSLASEGCWIHHAVNPLAQVTSCLNRPTCIVQGKHRLPACGVCGRLTAWRSSHAPHSDSCRGWSDLLDLLRASLERSAA